MTEVRVLIADDEALARTNLREALRGHPSFRIVGEATTGLEVVPAVQALRPDLLLLDIEMPGRDGVTVARDLASIDPCPAVVFVTAFSEYAVDAFQLCAVDYLLKPFDDERFADALARVESTLARDDSLMLRALSEQLALPKRRTKRLIIRSVGSIRVVPVEDVIWFRAGGNYVEVHHREGIDLHRVTLAALERSLNPREFARVHRSALVRLSEIRELKPGPDHSVAVMSNGDTVRVSQSYRDALIQSLEA